MGVNSVAAGTCRAAVWNIPEGPDCSPRGPLLEVCVWESHTLETMRYIFDLNTEASKNIAGWKILPLQDSLQEGEGKVGSSWVEKFQSCKQNKKKNMNKCLRQKGKISAI